MKADATRRILLRLLQLLLVLLPALVLLQLVIVVVLLHPRGELRVDDAGQLLEALRGTLQHDVVRALGVHAPAT